MDEQHPHVDYYQTLESNRTASYEEIKANYKRLLLSSHPDKVRSEMDNKFLLIQKAWSVLKDSTSRKQYDATLSCQEHNDFLLYDTIPLSNMNYDIHQEVYSFPCRCGGIYTLSANDSLTSKTVIGCDECSFSIQIKH